MTEETFRRTVFVHRDKMYRFARSLLLDDDDSFDLVQDVMEKLWRCRCELPGIRNMEAFAMQCLRHEAMNRIKRTKRVREYRNGLEEGVEREKYPSLVTDIIMDMIRSLPEKQRLVMHLRDVEEYETWEIAETLDMQESTVRVNLTRARQKVRDRLQKIFEHEKRQMEGGGG